MIIFRAAPSEPHRRAKEDHWHLMGGQTVVVERRLRARAGQEPRNQDLSKINRIVIVLQENHTFDNYFGTYPGAEGVVGKGICLPETVGSANCVSPFHDSSLAPVDMNHTWKSVH